MKRTCLGCFERDAVALIDTKKPKPLCRRCIQLLLSGKGFPDSTTPSASTFGMGPFVNALGHARKRMPPMS